MTIAQERITPKQAALYLERNVDHQRNLKRPHVAYLKGQILQDKWNPTASFIRFGMTEIGKEQLIDGQHRLQAIVESGKTVTATVIRGEPVENFHIIDTGIKARTAEDHAVIEGKDMPGALVPLMRWLFNYSKTKIPTVVPKPEQRLSEWELMNWGYENHYPILMETRQRLLQIRKGHNTGFTDKIMAYCHYQMSLIDAEMADDIMEYLYHGQYADGRPPVPTLHTARETLLKDMAELRAHGATQRVLAESQIPLIAHLWWCLMTGKENRKRRLVVSTDADNRFNFWS